MDALKEIEKFYPEIIDAMPQRFNSHDFILELAQHHQKAYIKVLTRYTDTESPFMSAHGQLAKMIGKYNNLVERTDYVNSKDIFGNSNEAMVWSKL